MKDQVCMSPNNGQLVVAIPLYRWHEQEHLDKLAGYSIALTNGKPLAYIIDGGEEMGTPQVMSAVFIESQLEFLGDLEPDSGKE